MYQFNAELWFLNLDFLNFKGTFKELWKHINNGYA